MPLSQLAQAAISTEDTSRYPWADYRLIVWISKRPDLTKNMSSFSGQVPNNITQNELVAGWYPVGGGDNYPDTISFGRINREVGIKVLYSKTFKITSSMPSRTHKLNIKFPRGFQTVWDNATATLPNKNAVCVALIGGKDNPINLDVTAPGTNVCFNYRYTTRYRWTDT